MRFNGIYWKVIGLLWFVAVFAIVFFSSMEYRKTIDYQILIIFCSIIGAIEYALGTILLALDKIYKKVE